MTLPSFFIPAAADALIASPNYAVRAQILRRLHGRCRKVQQASGGADALLQLERGDCQVLFLDRQLPDLDSGELMEVVQRRFPGIQVVMLDEKPGEPDEEQTHTLPVSTPEAEQAREFPLAISDFDPLPNMVGTSAAMHQVARMVRLVAPRSTTVLISGPTGSGKELVARAVHALSPRASRPLVTVNCAAIPESLLESELFGYTRGAFTGAVQSQSGRIAAAHGGTLFLDEIGELPLGMQAKLLRFLEQKEIQKLGSSEVTRVDVRVLAASNADLGRDVAQRRFREDLFYRLSAFPIELPPLSARVEDIQPLAQHFLACISAAVGIPCPQISREARDLLEHHSWRGNVRELQHVIERASILVGSEGTIRTEHLYFASVELGENPAAI